MTQTSIKSLMPSYVMDGASKQKYSSTVYDYAGKAELSMDHWKAERKLRGVGHLLGIIKQQLF